MAVAVRNDSSELNAMVSPNPAFATRRAQSLSLLSTRQGDWAEADCTTMPGFTASSVSAMEAEDVESNAALEKETDVPKLAARAQQASTSHFIRSLLRPAMTTESGVRAVAARSASMISA